MVKRRSNAMEPPMQRQAVVAQSWIDDSKAILAHVEQCLTPLNGHSPLKPDVLAALTPKRHELAHALREAQKAIEEAIAALHDEGE